MQKDTVDQFVHTDFHTRCGEYDKTVSLFYEDFIRDTAQITSSGNTGKVYKTVKIDMHCHDKGSSRPNERVGRMMGAAETWLEPEALMHTLKKNGMQAYTVTNHNNASSCYYLQDKGHDVLTGAEFTCSLPEDGIDIDVLAYGFSPVEETKLCVLRKNIYAFLDFCAERSIPVILAHPFYFYQNSSSYSPKILYKLTLLFKNFEVINGQRSSQQNLVIMKWLRSLTPEILHSIGKEVGIAPERYYARPLPKIPFAGSDDHMGIYAGLTGSVLYLPGDDTRKLSEQVLDAVRSGMVYPFGEYTGTERMAVSFLDYVCQLTLNLKNGGFFRLLMHKGTQSEKLISLGVANAVSELRRHRYTMFFLKSLHNAFQGKKVHFYKIMTISREFRDIMLKIRKIAVITSGTCRCLPADLAETINEIGEEIYTLFFSRIEKKFAGQITNWKSFHEIKRLISLFELPLSVRSWFGNAESGKEQQKNELAQAFNPGMLLDGLSFPFLAFSIYEGAFYTSTKVMHNNTSTINTFKKETGMMPVTKRILWLTDTFGDTNGISASLRGYLNKIQEYDLPIDLLVSSNSVKKEDHLITVPALKEITIPFYENQVFRIPRLMDIRRAAEEGGYSGVIASTEFLSGLIALYLKSAFSIPAWFFLHTDWIEFAKTTLKLEKSNLKQMLRFLRLLYGSYDGIYVLNKEDKQFMCGSSMKIPEGKVHCTAHWIDNSVFTRSKQAEEKDGNIFPLLMYAGRLSEEKGLKELPDLYKLIKSQFPHAKFTIAGHGPLAAWLKQEMPDAEFHTWLNPQELAHVYSSADMFIMPSRFDTFGRVVLESMACGCPVAAYACKGPADIIDHNKNGILVDTAKPSGTSMARAILPVLAERRLLSAMRKAAVKKASGYRAELILDSFLKFMHLNEAANTLREKPLSDKTGICSIGNTENKKLSAVY